MTSEWLVSQCPFLFITILILLAFVLRELLVLALLLPLHHYQLICIRREVVKRDQRSTGILLLHAAIAGVSLILSVPLLSWLLYPRLWWSMLCVPLSLYQSYAPQVIDTGMRVILTDLSLRNFILFISCFIALGRVRASQKKHYLAQLLVDRIGSLYRNISSTILWSTLLLSVDSPIALPARVRVFFWVVYFLWKMRPLGARVLSMRHLVLECFRGRAGRQVGTTPTPAQLERADDCSICSSALRDAEALQQWGEPVALPCGHVFHQDCILPWLERHHNCPLCRAEVPNPPPQVSEAATTPLILLPEIF